MKKFCVWVAAVSSLLAFGRAGTAEESPSYARQVKPFFARYCVECHPAMFPDSGLSLDTYKGLIKGGDSGAVIVPGKPDESKLILQVEGKANPFMPPKRAKNHPKPEEIAQLRAWIAAGAKDDSDSVKTALPDIKPRAVTPASVTALAYRPDGKLLAAGVYKTVTLIDPANGDVTGQLSGQTAKVTALAFSRDGKCLAVASGAAGTAGEVRLYTSAGAAEAEPKRVLTAHSDIIYDLAFSRDGKTLATCGYDRLIKLWDVASGKELRTLKDHSDAVYGLAFSPDGKLLASAAADRAVKVWVVATGRRLYTLGEATDWVYAVAWSPNGKHLAAAGVDKSIRVWEVTADGGRLVHSVFAHERPVTRLAYAADGSTLYSLSEDRTVKAWDAARMTERKVYAKQPEATLALAVRPDHKQIALGRFDGTALLLDEATGKIQAEPLPVKPKPPQLTKVTPNAGRRGQAIRLTLEGKSLDGATEVVLSPPGATIKLLPERASASQLQAEITLPADAPAGLLQVSVKTAAGQSAALPFTVDLFPSVMEAEPNNSASTGQPLTVPASVVGALSRAGDGDSFRIEARAGQEIGVQVLTSIVGSKVEPVLQLTDATGRVLAESMNGLLGHACDKAGVYALSIRDRDYRGGDGMHYRLHVGDIPIVTAVYPLGLQRGTEAEIHLQGVHLGATKSVRLKAPADAVPGTKLPVKFTTPQGTPLGNPSVVVGEFPEVVSARGFLIREMTKDGTCITHAPRGMTQNYSVAVPGTANGRLDQPGSTDEWRFPAKKGQRLILEVNARRLGSPLDSFIEVLDGQGQPVPRATLRCLAKTYVTFRDHDSAGANIRLEAWNELAINDYLYAGSELLRIRALPAHPDADCIFFSTTGQRTGYLDTTPTHLSLGTPLYKVSIHPPGTMFPPNGFPVINLPYRNDDGGPGYGKDSRLFFDPPADGDYQVRIGDARGQGGRAYAYRLTVRPPRPDFKLSFTPTVPSVWRGGAVPVTVNVERIDGFDGQIDLKEENLPPGLSAPLTNILPGENNTVFALFADAGAQNPAKGAPLKLVGRALIDGKEVIREATGGVPKVVDPGDIVTTTEQSEVTLKPGGEVKLTVRIERRGDFKGRVPLEVRGLPHGVRVLDIGLNGILITERETSRTIVLYAEPWVEATSHPIVVLAKREGKNTEHAARSMLLKVSN
jgi:hypothetical protein